MYHIKKFKNWRANSVDPDEVIPNDEPSDLDQCCLQIQLQSFLGALRFKFDMQRSWYDMGHFPPPFKFTLNYMVLLLII